MISIIIPAYNEEGQIGGLVTYLKKHSSGDRAEILLVDGGSTDGTKEEAEKAGAMVLNAPEKGRASQMNYGAEKSAGELLYFLHADTYPPATFPADIEEALKRGAEAGCFRLAFDDPHPALRFYSWFTRFDVDAFRFGDQSLFVKKALFQKAGRFDEKLLVMEDQEIVTRLKDHAQFSILDKNVVTSARKYQRFGAFRLQLIFAIIVVLFYLKISQEVLAHFYKMFMTGEPH